MISFETIDSAFHSIEIKDANGVVLFGAGK